MKRPFGAAAAAVSAWLALSGAALAQSNPGFVTGQVPTAAQWNSYFTAKQDALTSGSVVATWLAPGAAASNLGFTPLNPANNLLDVLNATTARGNLGLNTLGLLVPVTADGYSALDAVMTSGSNLLSSASRACTAGDAGKIVVAAGGGISNRTVSGGPYSITSGGATGISVSGSQPPFWAVGGWVYDQTTGKGVGTAVSWSSGTLTISGAGSYTVSSGDSLVFNFPFHSTVAYCSGTSYALADQATASVTSGTAGSSWAIGTDNSAVIASYAATYPNQKLIFPYGQILIDATTIPLNQNTLVGAGINFNRTASNGTSGQYGTTFLLTSETVQPFTVSTSVHVTGLEFFWPGQYGVTTLPVAYPPLFEPPNSTAQLQDVEVDHVGIINAYDIFYQPVNWHAMGNIRFHDNVEYAVHAYWTVWFAGEELFDTNNIRNGSVFRATISPSGTSALAYNLLTWSTANGDFFHAVGNGVAGGACSGGQAYGFNASGGILNGVHRVIDLTAAVMDESQIRGIDINGVGQMLYVDSASLFRGTTIGGEVLAGLNNGYYPNNSLAVFDYEGTCNNIAGEIKVEANVSSNSGRYVYYLAGTNLKSVDIHGESMAYGTVINTAAATSGGPYSITNGNNTTITVTSGSPGTVVSRRKRI